MRRGEKEIRKARDDGEDRFGRGVAPALTGKDSRSRKRDGPMIPSLSVARKKQRCGFVRTLSSAKPERARRSDLRSKRRVCGRWLLPNERSKDIPKVMMSWGTMMEDEGTPEDPRQAAA
eukprot:378370-Rhodomonas_salina.2